MEKALDKVLAIIDRHMSEYTKRMDAIVTYEMDLVDNDCVLSKSESESIDCRWREAFERRAELADIYAEIVQTVVIQ